VPRFFLLGVQDQMAKNGGRTSEGQELAGVLGEGQQAPSPQLWGLGERCELPSGVRIEPRPPKSFPLFFSTRDDLSWHYNISNCGLSCNHWRGQDPHGPLHTPCCRRTKQQQSSRRSVLIVIIMTMTTATPSVAPPSHWHVLWCRFFTASTKV